MFLRSVTRWGAFALALGLGALAMGACSDDAPEDVRVVERGRPIVIGVSTMVKGDLASLGEALRDAAQLAGDGVYIAGHPVRFVTVNDGCTFAGGGSAARELIGRVHAVAVVGPSCSDAVRGAQEAYEKASVTHISQLSTNPATTHPEGRDPFGTFFRTSFNDDVQGLEQAKFAQQTLRARDVFIAYESFRYGGAVAQFRSNYTGRVVGDLGFERSGIAATAKAAAAANPSLVYFAGFFDTGVEFVRTLREAGYKGPVLGGDAIYDQAMITGLGALAEGGLFVTLPSPPAQGAAYAEFARRYRARYSADATGTAFLGESFDAATVIIKALQVEGVAVDDDGDLRIDLARLNEAISLTSMEGASGRVAFDAQGDRQTSGVDPVTIFTVKDGKFATVPR